MSVQILVRLETPDPAARSALGSLRRRGEQAANLERLDRSTLIELHLPSENAGTRAAIDRLLSHTSVIANPNKERASANWDPAGTVLERPGLLVCERGATERPALAARIARMDETLVHVRAFTGTLWVPFWQAPPEEWGRATAALAGLDGEQPIGVLLVNPHANVARVVVDRIAQRTLSTLAADEH